MSWDIKFSCGCVIPKEESTRKRIKGCWHYMCPNHPKKGKMIARITVCEWCSKKFTINTQGKVPFCCPTCTPKRKVSKSKNVSIIPLNNPDIQANMERSNCKWRIPICLLKYADDPKHKDYLPCKDCLKYFPIKDKPVSFSYRGQRDWLDCY